MNLTAAWFVAQLLGGARADRVVIFKGRMVKTHLGTIRSLGFRPPSGRSTAGTYTDGVKGGIVPAWRSQTSGTRGSVLNALSVQSDGLRHLAPGSEPLMIELVVLAGIVAVIFVQLIR
jgi:hypothetical protein